MPLAVHFDLTYRCNERCVHCYLDHDDHGEMTTAEVKDMLDQLATAGTLFLTFSGGELLLRKDFFDLLAYARGLQFERQDQDQRRSHQPRGRCRIRELGVRQVQISVYSHRAEVHDAITKVPGSLERTLAAIRVLTARGLKVTDRERADAAKRRRLPRRARAGSRARRRMHDGPDDHAEDGRRHVAWRCAWPRRNCCGCSGIGRSSATDSVARIAGAVADPRTLDRALQRGPQGCYISPYGDIYPCVQFPLPSGNLRRQRFEEIWSGSPQLAEVPVDPHAGLKTCSSCTHVSRCTRCPGVASMEGNMRGPSSADCEKSTLRAHAASTEGMCE